MMPKEYIYNPADVVGGTKEHPEYPNAIRISWSREDAGGIVQVATFRKDDSYEEEHEKPQFVSLNRSMINDTIRILRRARDQAYGEDA